MTDTPPLTMGPPVHLTPDWTMLQAWLPIPGMGFLTVNSFLKTGAEPLLVDTGLAAVQDDFLAALSTLIDPKDLSAIWLSHMDADHIGNLNALMKLAPRAHIYTNFLGQGKLGLMGMDTDRVRLVEAGQSVTIGGSKISAIKPPYYDAPETIGLFDPEAKVVFTADSFGAVLPEPCQKTADIDDKTLEQGIRQWADIDTPWLDLVDSQFFRNELEAVWRMDAELILSGHLPPAHRSDRRLVAAAHKAAEIATRVTSAQNPRPKPAPKSSPHIGR